MGQGSVQGCQRLAGGRDGFADVIEQRGDGEVLPQGLEEGRFIQREGEQERVGGQVGRQAAQEARRADEFVRVQDDDRARPARSSRSRMERMRSGIRPITKLGTPALRPQPANGW